MSTVSANGKRKHAETIDLAAEDSDDHASKRQTPARRPTSDLPGSFQPGSQYSNDQRQDWLNEDEDDINVLVGSTQDAAEGTDQLHHYGDVDTKIVGIRYYRGFASKGEVILIRREPRNPYDGNAIRIDNVNTEQIGHIPRRMAEKLAKYIDNHWLHCEGKLAGYMGEFDCPLTVSLFGPDPNTDEGRALVERMNGDKLSTKALKEAERARKRQEKERQQEEKRRQQEQKRQRAEALRAASGGKGSSIRDVNPNSEYANQTTPGDDPSEPVMEDILEASQRFNPREASRTADQCGMQEDALKQLPLAAKPDAITTTMLPYQLQGLQWLLDHESPPLPGSEDSEAVQLWKKHPEKQGVYTNLATSYSMQGTPKFASGGILADDMGLGKTLEMIALLAADSAKSGGKGGTTLIVSPLSVMSNWSDQISRHVHEHYALKVYTYHAAGRVRMKAADFAQYDVVITTYQTLASDWMPRGKGASKQSQQGLRPNGLYSMEWCRIVSAYGITPTCLRNLLTYALVY